MRRLKETSRSLWVQRVDARAQVVVGEVVGVVELVPGRQQLVVGEHAELLGLLREQAVRDDAGVDLDLAVALLEAPRVLGAQHVDAAVQLAPAARDVALVRHLLFGQRLEIGVGERGEVGKGLHAAQSSRFPRDLPPGVEVEDRAQRARTLTR